MRIAISNIAWDVADDERVAALLRGHGVDAIDVAPGKYFPDPKAASASDMRRVRDWWRERAIGITGMQSLLFGTVGLNLFGVRAVQDAMLDHLAAVCRIASGLGATRLVFGSPKNRDRAGLSDAAAHDIAVAFFRRLGDLAGESGVLVCLEPCPARYGANFMIDSSETAAIVVAVAHPAIRMQLDTGTMTINGESPVAAVRDCAPLIGHIHASEPDLVTLGDGGTDHAAIAAALRTWLPGHVLTIEMLPARQEDNLVALARALGVAIHHYRGPGRQGAGT